jgi:alpha-tubulin suppressor-like RCC1 family protein
VVSGGIRCWGDNNSGELGNGRTDRTGISTPVQTLPAGSGATAIAAGVRFSCAVINGEVKCWGLNNVGQLGDTTTTARTAPVTTIATGATAVTAGANHACAIVNAGLRCWGANRYVSVDSIGSSSNALGLERFGILGNGSRVDNSLTPLVVIPDGSNVNSVSGGLNQTYATVNGFAICWG